MMLDALILGILLWALQPQPQPISPVARAEVVRAKCAIQAAGYRVGEYHPGMSGAIAAYDTRARVIRINPYSSWWTTPVTNARREYEQGWFSTPSVDHIIRHEMAHADLHAALGQDLWQYRTRGPLPLAPQRIRRVVSGYAANNPADFHAEVQAGLLYGRKFPADVMAAYRAMQTP